VRLVSALGEEIEHGWHDGDVAASPRLLLERLAVLPTVSNRDLYTGWVDESVTAGLCVAVLGDVDDHDRDFLARLHHRGSASYAVVLDVDTWAARMQQPEFTRRPGRQPTSVWLRQRGWKAADLGREGSLQAAWQELGR
jgi:hypothetical protein